MIDDKSSTIPIVNFRFQLRVIALQYFTNGKLVVPAQLLVTPQ